MEDRRKRSSGDLFETCSAAETANAPKKRKVRKGTLSCWECKRRKIRCTFAALTDTICDGCRSRQTRCISQEFHDEVALPSKKVDRLSRVESLVEQLFNGKEKSGMLASGQPGQGNTSVVCHLSVSLHTELTMRSIVHTRMILKLNYTSQLAPTLMVWIVP